MKKITLGVFALSVIALLGVGIVAAFPFGFGKMNQNLSEEQQAEIQAFHDSLETAIENNDFSSWKSLMESQLTEDNFNKVVEDRKNMESMREEMQKFCEENDCPDPADRNGYDFRGHHGMMGFGVPHMQDSSE